MSYDIIMPLITNIILLMSLSVIYSLFSNRKNQSYFSSKIIIGIAASFVGLVVMSNSVEVEPGIFFDGRTMVTLLTGMYFGWIPFLFNSIFLSAYRFYMGGNGAIPGVIWVIFPGIIGLIWRKYRLKINAEAMDKVTVLEQYLLAFVVQLIAIGILYMFPNKISDFAINAVSFPLISVYPIGGLLVSMFMLRSRKHYFSNLKMLDREREYNELFNQGSHFSFLVNPVSGKIEKVNQVAIDFYGYTDEEFLELTVFDLNPLPKEEVTKLMAKVSSKEISIFSLKHRKKNGVIVDVEVSSTPINIQGVDYLYSNVLDITSRVKTQYQFFEVNKKLNATLQNVNEGIIVSDVYGKIEIVNDVARKYFINKPKIISKSIKDVVELSSQNGDSVFADIYDNMVSSATPFSTREPFINLKNSKTKETFYEFSLSPIFFENNLISGSIFVIRDVTSIYSKNEEIKYASQHDFLTGLYNRYFIEAELNRLDTERQLPLSIISGDINGLKLINDSYGHAEGDNLISEIGNILKKATRSEDIISRWGGDEFLILLPQTSYENSQKVTSRIFDLCHKSMFNIITPSISLGIATKTNMNTSINSIIIEAEKQMYANKQSESKIMHNEFLFNLITKLQNVHPELGTHSKRVTSMVEQFCDFLGLPASEVKILILLAKYHDIGWVAIEELIKKKEKLTLEESEITKIHPDVGFRIMKSIPELTHLADLIYHHHERWDGKGYPEQLKGDDIPYYSRIIAIVDAYDFMINISVNKKILSKHDAIIKLEENAGIQFDPKLVNQFIDMLTK
jgi:diguanylate cyclase (GGDEF)-like protein/PAS domain S-box-containing protein